MDPEEKSVMVQKTLRKLYESTDRREENREADVLKKDNDTLPLAWKD